MYYYHADGLGSIVALSDSSGKAVQDYEYDSFGNLHDMKYRIKQPYTFTGREWDRETGLYFYRARYYDAEIGRFTSKDPIGIAGGVNAFIYVENRPIILIDPLGLASANLYYYESGVWNKDTTIKADLGQVVTIDVTNVNILGTTISLNSNYGQTKEMQLILPQQSKQFTFSVFACEPVYWEINITTQSDAFIVNYEIKSTWVPGMPINP